MNDLYNDSGDNTTDKTADKTGDKTADKTGDDINDSLDLQNLWQQSAPVDVDALIKSVDDAQRRMRRFFYFELVNSALGFAVLAWMFALQLFGDQWWMLVFIGVVCLASQIWAWTWRKDLWNAFAKSPAELFALKRKHLWLDIKIARSFYIGVVVGAVIGTVFSFFDTGDRPLELSGLTRISLLTGAVALLVFFFVWGVRKEIRARKKLKALDKQIAEYESGESL